MFAINGKVHFDKIKIEADYFVTGRIFQMPIHGTGMLTADFSKYHTIYYLFLIVSYRMRVSNQDGHLSQGSGAHHLKQSTKQGERSCSKEFMRVLLRLWLK